ncbi:MAG: hypothetical protein GKR90_00165 [Pseudomonadales bacterium]|nr:hypothetical protein [Pseudomonadales bacterium]
MSILSLRKLRGKQDADAKTRGEFITTELLPRVFSAHNRNTEIHVLDVGIGITDTTEFLQNHREQDHRCKVYFLDLAPALKANSSITIGEVFAEYTGELFDVCLFWDLLHRLDHEQLNELSDALEPYVYSGTRAHALVNLSNPSERYRIRAEDQLEVDLSTPHDYRTNSLTALRQHFSCLQTLDDRFRCDGRLELLLGTDAH